jgi:hypothetical protein
LGVLHYKILTMPERFISEPIKPLTETADAALRSWRETGKCRHGSPKMYVRKHWYEVATESDGIMKLYFERQPRRGQKGARWWLFSIREPE